jgi:hypothetical protein
MMIGGGDGSLRAPATVGWAGLPGVVEVGAASVDPAAGDVPSMSSPPRPIGICRRRRSCSRSSPSASSRARGSCHEFARAYARSVLHRAAALPAPRANHSQARVSVDDIRAPTCTRLTLSASGNVGGLARSAAMNVGSMARKAIWNSRGMGRNSRSKRATLSNVGTSTCRCRHGDRRRLPRSAADRR